MNNWREESNLVGVAEGSIVRHDPLSPTPNEVYREAGPPSSGGGLEAVALLHPWVIALAILALIVVVVRWVFKNMLVPLFRWIFRIEPPLEPLKVRTRVDSLEQLAAHNEDAQRELAIIERAPTKNPEDLSLLPRIQELTAKVKSVNEVLEEQALASWPEIAAQLKSEGRNWIP